MSVRHSLLRLVMSAALGALAACHHQKPAVSNPSPAAGGGGASTPTSSGTNAGSGGGAARPDGTSEMEMARQTLTAKIFFDFDRWELSVESQRILEAKLGVLRANPNLKLVIEGNADDKGSDEYNLALGQRRAAAAKQFFVQRDIDGSRIEIVSYGEQRPACGQTTDPCRAQNRRAEFRVAAGM